MYPRLLINSAKLAANVRTMVSLCAEHNLKVVGVTKCCCGDERVARIFAENGVAALGDSRVENLARYADLPIEKWLIRTPQASDAERIVTYADASLNSELATLRALDAAAGKLGRTHKAILMYDLGDLREGFISTDELMEAAELCMELEHIELAGVGANLTCLSFVQASAEKMEQLAALARQVKERFGLEDLYVSAGNSATLHQMMTEGLPPECTSLRLGESLLLGRERACYEYLPGTYNDDFIIEAEVVEAKRKPSMPWGTIGPDSYGVIHEFEDTGEQVRAILACGNQDIDTEVMWPVDERLKIVGCSCDHTVMDISAAADEYPVGSIVQLRCGYHAVLRAFTSPYVEKVFS